MFIKTYLLAALILPCFFAFGQSKMEVKTDTITNMTDSTISIIKSVTQYSDGVSVNEIDYANVYFSNWILKESYTTLMGAISGAYKSYYKNGNLKEECFYERGRKVGLYTSYHPNGKISVMGRYQDIKCFSDITYKRDTTARYDPIFDDYADILVSTYPLDIKIGKWLYYSTDGDLIKTEDYNEQGELITIQR